MISNKGLNSNEALEESTATNSSVILSGIRREKEAPEDLDIEHYFPDLAYSVRCLNPLVPLFHVGCPTILPKSWWPCFPPRPRSNSSLYSKSSCLIFGNETPPVAAKKCCACVLMKSSRAWLIRAR